MWLAWRARSRAQCSTQQHLRRYISGDASRFVAGDLALLRQKLDRAAPPILTRPLKPGRQINGHKGIIGHEQIIGRRARDVVRTEKLRSGKDGTEYRLHRVTLEEYVRLSRRLVTPIYPADASVIVELLDIHIEPFRPGAERGTTLEILEAGTGHGALTLYLSRAIHAANPPRPTLGAADDEEVDQNTLAAWKQARQAVIHSVDSSAKFSAHAETVVKGFRRGMYYHDIDFHVTDVGAWTLKSLAERGNQPFLAHAFLDLSNAETHLEVVARALRTDGCLIVFNPSITQIIECVRKIKEEGLLLELASVIELGVNGSSGGREWNVKAVKPRAKKVDAFEDEDLAREEEGPVDGEAGAGVGAELGKEVVPREDANSLDRWSMICRPKVGERITGGGFLGVWRKQLSTRPTS